jgi:DNA-binding PadR family transcriptional regulator
VAAPDLVCGRGLDGSVPWECTPGWASAFQAIVSRTSTLSLESSTITPLVKRLEAASLVTRTRNREDERRVLVALTRRGRELREKSRCLGETLLARSGMEPKELIALNHELRRLREHLARADGSPAVDA